MFVVSFCSRISPQTSVMQRPFMRFIRVWYGVFNLASQMCRRTGSISIYLTRRTITTEYGLREKISPSLVLHKHRSMVWLLHFAVCHLDRRIPVQRMEIDFSKLTGL